MNIQQMIQNLLGGPMWRISDAVDILTQPAFASTMAGIKIAAGIMAFGILCLQAFKIFMDGFQGQEAFRKAVTALIVACIIMAFIQTPLYSVFMKVVIAGPPQTIAGMVRDAYNQDFLTVVANSWKAIGASKSEGFMQFNLDIGSQLISTLASGIVYLVSTILLIIMPILQKMLFKLMVIIGPLCMVFALSDYTKSIAKQWLNLTLSIAWLGVFASIAQYLSLTAQTAMINEVQNPFSTIIYGMVSIIIQISAFGITSFLFGAVGSGLDRMANPVTAGAAATSAVASVAGTVGTAGLATGAIATGAGAMMHGVSNVAQRFAPQQGAVGDAMRGIAGGMQAAGSFMQSTGQYVGGKSEGIIQMSRGRMPGNAAQSTASNIQAKQRASVGGDVKKEDTSAQVTEMKKNSDVKTNINAQKTDKNILGKASSDTGKGDA